MQKNTAGYNPLVINFTVKKYFQIMRFFTWSVFSKCNSHMEHKIVASYSGLAVTSVGVDPRINEFRLQNNISKYTANSFHHTRIKDINQN